ncbi:hypothetical protein [Kitasatospora sp. NPDC059827]|uniref:hypothetical protein n=1 Tax=Kitasatospora sp. NPDC059827 TaxID=3346964 RepID=UPI00365A35F8
MPTSEPLASDGAAAALQAAERARTAAAASAAPVWLAPAQGALFAGATILLFGFGGPGSPAGGLWGNLAGAAAAVALVVLNVRETRRTGISLWPAPGRTGSHALLPLLPLAVYALGWLAAVPAGRVAGAVVSGLAGGLALAVVALLHNAAAKARHRQHG